MDVSPRVFTASRSRGVSAGWGPHPAAIRIWRCGLCPCHSLDRPTYPLASVRVYAERGEEAHWPIISLANNDAGRWQASKDVTPSPNCLFAGLPTNLASASACIVATCLDAPTSSFLVYERSSLSMVVSGTPTPAKRDDYAPSTMPRVGMPSWSITRSGIARPSGRFGAADGKF